MICPKSIQQCHMQDLKRSIYCHKQNKEPCNNQYDLHRALISTSWSQVVITSERSYSFTLLLDCLSLFCVPIWLSP